MEPSKHFTQEQKLAILESAQSVGIKKALVLAQAHYTTIYEWRRQLEALGEAAFLAKKTVSRERGFKRVTESQEKAVIETWQQHPGFGPGQVRNLLRRQGRTISTRTVQRVMTANGYVGKRKRLQRNEVQRFEATRPLELFQMDILELYYMTMRQVDRMVEELKRQYRHLGILKKKILEALAIFGNISVAHRQEMIVWTEGLTN